MNPAVPAPLDHSTPKMPRLDFLLILLMILCVCGCASNRSKALNYETIKANPKRDPDAAARLNRQGVEALSRGRTERAESLFKDALIKDVDYGPAHNNLGRLYFDQGKNYLAAWEFEYAVKVMPNRGEPFNNLGMVMERVGKMEQAIEAFETAYSLCPNNPEIVGNLARAWWSHDQDNPKTRELLEKLVFVDSRPDWVAWAKEQIACGRFSSGEILPVSLQQDTPFGNEPPAVRQHSIPQPAPQSVPFPMPQFAPYPSTLP
jgi:tetratricopeptide (TPR) repeat protein